MIYDLLTKTFGKFQPQIIRAQRVLDHLFRLRNCKSRDWSHYFFENFLKIITLFNLVCYIYLTIRKSKEHSCVDIQVFTA